MLFKIVYQVYLTVTREGVSSSAGEHPNVLEERNVVRVFVYSIHTSHFHSTQLQSTGRLRICGSYVSYTKNIWSNYQKGGL